VGALFEIRNGCSPGATFSRIYPTTPIGSVASRESRRHIGTMPVSNSQNRPRVPVYLPAADLAELRRRAEARRSPVAELVREAVAAYLRPAPRLDGFGLAKIVTAAVEIGAVAVARGDVETLRTYGIEVGP